MKILLMNVVFILAFTATMTYAQVPASQDTIVIPGGAANAGLLETTINGDKDGSGNRLNPNRVYKLEAGFHYVKSAINVNNPDGTIRIVGAEGGKKPVIIPVVVDGVEPGQNRITSSLELKNLHIQGRNDEGGYWKNYLFIILGNDRKLTVEDCLIEFAQRGFKLQDVPQGLEIEMRNNYFRDFFNTGQLWAGNVIDAKYVPIEKLVFENNTVSNGQCVLLLQQQFIKYALINHNTFINTSTFLTLNHYYYEAYITNNVFYNCNMIGEEFNLIQGAPDKVSTPIIPLDTLDIKIGVKGIPAYAMDAGQTALVAPYNDIDNYKIYVADNIYHNESALDKYYNGEYNSIGNYPVSYLNWNGVAGPHEVSVPAKWMGERENAFFANYSGIKEENNILDQDPQLATEGISETSSEQLAIWMRKMYEVKEETRTPDMTEYYFGDFNPTTIPGIETEDGDGITKFSDLIEDFSIGSGFKSKSDGFSIGALHWTGEINSFSSEASLSAIQQAYSTLASQDTIVIPGGAANAGLLETTINGDKDGSGNRLNPNRVYKLEAGFHYVKSAINVNNPDGTIRIVGAEGGKKPVIIPVVVDGVEPGQNRITSSLELKNLHIQGRNDEGGYWKNYLFIILGNDRKLTVEDCLIEFAQRGFKLQDVPQGLEIEMRNNYFRDFFNTGQLWAGNVIDAKYVPIEKLVFENNTVSNGQCVLLLQQQFIKYALINHNTFINTSTFLTLNHYYYEAYITNNVFYNCNMIGEEFNLIQGAPDKVSTPIIPLDTLDIKIGVKGIPAYAMDAGQTALVAPYNDIDNYKIYVADNIYHNESALDKYYNGEYNSIGNYPVSYLNWNGVAGPHEVSVPAKWMGERENAFFANYSGIKEENNILDQDPQLATEGISETSSEQLAIWMRKMYEVKEETRTPDMTEYYFGDFNPTTIPGVETEDGDGITKFSDLIEDFSIGSGFKSKSDGYSIGALHWTGEINNFSSEASLSAIQQAYDTPTAIDYKELSPADNSVFNTYPNPFKSSVQIEYSVKLNSHVRLAIHNSVGSLVKILVDGEHTTGIHEESWNASDMPAGIYYCTIVSNGQMKTAKLILTK